MSPSIEVVAIHPNLKQLSHSSNVTLHKCPRKYELYKLLPVRDADGEGDEHLDFGSIVGVGVQDILINKSLNSAYYCMFRNWKNILDAEEGQKARKTFWHALLAIDKFQLATKTFLANYELAWLNGKPAVELGFTVDCGDGFNFRGKIDAILIDTKKKEIIVLENKTTKNNKVHEAQYKHSAQGVGYSLIVDIVTQLLLLEQKSSYKVNYLVYKTFGLEWELIPFIKSHTERALWIKGILTDKRHIQEYAADQHFPIHGESCYDFGRVCQFFDHPCTLSNRFLIGDLGKVAVKVDKEGEYPYKFRMEELIESQLRKQEEELAT